MGLRAAITLAMLLPVCLVRGQDYAIAPADNPDISALTKTIDSLTASPDLHGFQEQLFEMGREYEHQKAVKHAWYCFEAYLAATRLTALVDFAVSSQSDLRNGWTQVRHNLKHIQAFAAGHSTRFPFFGALACDVELFTKSLLLNSAIEVRRRIADPGDSEMLARWDELSELRQRIAHRQASLRRAETGSAFAADTLPGKETEPGRSKTSHYIGALKRGTDSLERAMQELETSLIRESTVRGDFRIGADFTAEWTDVRDALAEGEAHVEFFTYPGPGAERHYAALVIQSRSEYPRLIPIGPESRITAAMKGRFDFDGLWFELWRPLEYHLGYASDVYIAPAGILNALPFAALHNIGDFIADHYTLHNVLSGKDLIEGRHRPAPFSHKRAVLVGGADFGYAVPGGSSEAQHGADGQESLHGQGFGYLPGSLREVSGLGDILRGRGWSVKTLIDTDATEKGVRASVAEGGPEILHLSTHGFHMPQSGAGSAGGNIFSHSAEPLMRSGLLFTGANRVWRGGTAADPTDDGILTGLEIAHMDLSATRLALLSACQTGLGMIDNSEGVYGLQRAFRLAGVRTVIVTLWKVPDDESARMMTDFYRQLAAGKPAKAAFDHAQTEARRRNPYDPYRWAGFVLIE